MSITYETPGTDSSPAKTVCWYDSENFVVHFKRDQDGLFFAGCLMHPLLIITFRNDRYPFGARNRAAPAFFTLLYRGYTRRG